MSVPKTWAVAPTTEVLLGTDLNNNFQYLDKLTTEGDIIYGGASGVPTRLARGTNGQMLYLNSGVPSWGGGLFTDSLTAYATGGQTNATQLNLGTNIITTCTTRLDSVKLPSTFAAGDEVIIVNNGAKTANVYPASGDTITGLSANAPVMLLPYNTLRFKASTNNSTWKLIAGHIQETIELSLSTTGTNSWSQTSGSATGRISIDTISGSLMLTKFNVEGTTSSSTGSTVTVANVTFKTGNTNGQAVTVYANVAAYHRGVAGPGVSTITVTAGGNATVWNISACTIALDSQTII